jgi:L-seryl-tRNA(Ser) seleniumtransferase
VDKLTLAALEATLRLYLRPDQALAQIPTLRMLTASAEQLLGRAEPIVALLRDRGINAQVLRTNALVGGGAFPDLEFPSGGFSIEVSDPAALEGELRKGTSPVIARIAENRVVLDLRTVDPDQDVTLAERLIDVISA